MTSHGLSVAYWIGYDLRQETLIIFHIQISWDLIVVQDIQRVCNITGTVQFFFPCGVGDFFVISGKKFIVAAACCVCSILYDLKMENQGDTKRRCSLIRTDKGLKIAVQTEKCAACQKTVYAMEKMEMDKNVYHKSCFKCSHCSARLTPKTFSINEGVMYCTNHFTQLFRRKGNYDEGFGRQPHKKKWSGDSALDEHEAEKASA